MYVDRELRTQLNALSKELFGVQSRWQKLLESSETVTREVDEEVPAVTETRKNDDGTETVVEVSPATTKKVQVAVLVNPNPLDAKNPNGRPYKVAKRRTPEEVLEMLTNMKVQFDEFKAKMAAEQKAQKEAKDAQDAYQRTEALVRESAHGSAAV